MLQTPRISPARSFEEALARTAQLQSLDGPEILPQAHTTLLHGGAKTALAVVLLHGFTNHPGQYALFAPLLRKAGANVLIPRLPKHGDRDRLTNRLARLTAESLLQSASTAVDIACGLGERVCVAGISSSGLLCAYFAQYRPDVARSVIVSPVFALLGLSRKASRAAELALRAFPNAFLWWDPRVKNGMHPITAYPRFATRALAQVMRIGDDVYERSKTPALRSGKRVCDRQRLRSRGEQPGDGARAG